MRKPYFVTRLKCWYFKDSSGRAIRLDPDEDEAYRKWEHFRQIDRVGTTDDVTFAALVEAWIIEHRKMATTQFAQQARYVSMFAIFLADKLCLEVSKGDLTQWLATPKPGRLRKVQGKEVQGPPVAWSRTTQAHAANAIRRVYRWAVGEGKLSRNPIETLSVPQGKPRMVVIQPGEHRALVAEARKHNPPFAMYLIASRCGARPAQIREVTRECVHITEGGRMFWIFNDHKTVEKTQKPLVVYCHPCLATITRILAATTNKFLFVNQDGNQWLKDTVVQAMDRLRKRAGVNPKITVYAYRHSFATDALLAGNSLAVVAELLGHVDTRMVGRVYGHLDQHKSHLLDAAESIFRKRHG
jgi:integrase